MNLKHLTDSELLARTEDAVKAERRSMTVVLYHLLEVEERRLFSPHPSLHVYCVKQLKYSAPAAQRRIDAMRVLRVLPEVSEKIQSGSLNLTTLSQAQSFFRHEKKVDQALAPEQKREVLAAIETKSTREVDRELLGRATEPLLLKKKDRVRAVSATLSELKCLVTDEALEDLDRLKGLLGHKHPDLSTGELLGIIAKIALKELDPGREPKRKRKAPADTKELRTAKPAPEVNPRHDAKPAPEVSPQLAKRASDINLQGPKFSARARTRYIPAQVKREVWQDAHGKCALCQGVFRLQLDHIEPHALGGSNERRNLRLLCFHCNQREAGKRLGREKMQVKSRLDTPVAAFIAPCDNYEDDFSHPS